MTALFAETSFSSQSKKEVSRGATLVLRFGTLTVLPASLFAALVAAQLLDLFSGGGTYVRGIPYLQLITLFYLFFAYETVPLYILQGIRRTHEVLMVPVGGLGRRQVEPCSGPRPSKLLTHLT